MVVTLQEWIVSFLLENLFSTSVQQQKKKNVKTWSGKFSWHSTIGTVPCCENPTRQLRRTNTLALNVTIWHIQIKFISVKFKNKK
jgi:hypothetical protein